MTKNWRIEPLAWLALVISFAMTGIALHISTRNIEEKAHQRFELQREQWVEMLTGRLVDYETILRAAAGFVTVTGKFDRAAWQDYVSTLRLRKNWPGIQELGLAMLTERIPGGGAAEGAAAFPAQQLVVKHVESFDEVSQYPPGSDLLADPDQRLALALARDSGEAVLSGKLMLKRAAETAPLPGFMLYVPVFRQHWPTEEVAQRRDAIQGYVFGSFLARDFMQSVLGNTAGFDIRLYDGESVAAEQLLFANHPVGMPGPGRLNWLNMHFFTQTALVGEQHKWTLIIESRSDYLTQTERVQPLLILVGGLFIDFGLFFLVAFVGQQRRHYEARAVQLTQQLKESELVLSSSIEAIGEAFAIFDSKDRLVFFNDRFRELHPISAPVIKLGSSFETIVRYGAERGQYPEAVGRVEAFVRERMAWHRSGDKESIQSLGDGRWVKIREHLTPSGHIVGFRVDVTEFYQAKEAAEAANLSKSQFLAMMSHEIRTPMNGILGMAQVLLAPNLSEQERQHCVQAILASGQTLLTLLNDLLDLSKVEAGHFELHPVPFSPFELVRECALLFHAQAQEKDLSLQVEIDLPPAIVYVGDTMRLRQMLANLLGNAIKFTSAGGVTLAVQLLETSDTNALLEFSVSDTGMGIPPDQASKLFEPFSQLDASMTRQFGGTGLGLAIVRSLANLMGGLAGFSSQPGVGSRFWFRVPLTFPASNSVLPAEQAQLAFTAPDSVLNGRILVVEDDRIHQQVIERALAKLGLTVQCLENGQAAVECIQAGERFNLILMDIEMPVLDGLSATQAIREWERRQGWTGTPIVVISADAFEDDRSRSEAAGANDFLPKPIDLRMLDEALRKCLPMRERGAASAPSPETRPLDMDCLFARIEALVPLLQRHKFSAFAAFNELKGDTEQTEVAPAIEAIGKVLYAMQFDEAIEGLRHFAASHGRSLAE